MQSNTERIRQEIRDLTVEQKKLAEKLYVTPQAVSKWVHGESRPSLDNAKLIYKVTGFNIMEMEIRLQSSDKKMEIKDLKEIDDYTKAKQESKDILQTAKIRENYSHTVYKLCTWLLPAVICLTHHQMINQTEEEVDYSRIFTNLLDYLDDQSIKKKQGLYENQLEYNFYLMGEDLFESFDEYMIPDDAYCQTAMYDWYRFKKAVIKDDASPVYNELLVAITEIAEIEE